jgi:hypothetical protein
MEFSRCARNGEEPAGAGLSKLNSVRTADVEVDVVLGESSDRTATASRGGIAINDLDGPRSLFSRAPDSLERR